MEPAKTCSFRTSRWLTSPGTQLPREIVDVLRPVLADVADEVIDAVRDVPAYARPLEGPFGDGLRAGVQEALRHFLAEIEAGGPVPRSDVYVTLGRGEMRAGRSLDSLLSAYRLGARVAWRRFAAAGVEAGLEPETLYLLAESIFAYIDALSAESAEGHALEQSAAASEAELRRRRLVRLLVREPPADPTWSRPPPARPAGRCRGRSPRSRSAASSARPPPRGCRRTRSPRRSASSSARSSPIPTVRAGRAAIERAVARRRGERRPRHDGRLERGGGQLRARARRRWPSPDGLAGADRRARAGGRAAAAQRPASRPRAGARPARAAGRAAGRLARPPDRDADACGSPSRDGSGRSPTASASIRRPRATGSAGCASCSATRSTIPDERFWLELALRVR